jgi:hypothetical protein
VVGLVCRIGGVEAEYNSAAGYKQAPHWDFATGLMRTDFAGALWENPKLLEATENRKPDDIAGAAAFPASRAENWIDVGVTIA